MLKKLLKKVMFHSKINKNKELLNIPKDQISLSLSKEEIAILLQSIKNSNFSGSVLEDLYNLVYKLQTNFNKLK
jgi:ribosomal protein S7|tara:strand:+ start:333 stop:554 length:222 start_codon:yes stop_codon:yes gene_type:complete